MAIMDLIRAFSGGDPSAQVLAGGTPGVPAGPAPGQGAATAGTGGVGATPIPGQAGVAPVGGAQPPPDLSALYSRLVNDQRRSARIDSGLTMLAASAAHPENRAALIGMAGDQMRGASGGAADALRQFMSMRQSAAEQDNRASMRARIPEIAERYGLDLNTAYYLFEAGKLEETLDTLTAKREVVPTRDGGRAVAGVVNTGPVNDFSREIDIQQMEDGSRVAIDKNTGEQIYSITGPGQRTPDMIELDRVNAERAAAGQPPMPAEEWLAQRAAARSRERDTLGGQFASTYVDQYNKAIGMVDSFGNLRQVQRQLDDGIIAGDVTAPLRLEAAKMAATFFGMDPELAANTEQFRAAMGQEVLNEVKALGTGNSISNADREFAEKMVGGAIQLTPQAIRRINQIRARQRVLSVERHNARVRGIVESDRDNASLWESLLVDVPDIRDVAFPPQASDRLYEAARSGDAERFEEERRLFDEYYGNGMSGYALRFFQ